MYVTKEAIEEVRRSNDLVQVIRSRGVELKRKGRNYVGRCPFHEDRTPSLVVSPEKQLWNCLGACAASGQKSGGDVITFVMRKDGVNFAEALRRLAVREPLRGDGDAHSSKPTAAAVREPAAPMPGDDGERAIGIDSRARRDLLRRVVDHYHRSFRERQEGQEYLRRRGLTDPEMFAALEVGYSDGSLLKMLDADTARTLTEIGVLTPKGRELLLGCVVFPLTLPDLGVVSLYGRYAGRTQHLYLPGPHRGVFHWQAMKGSQEIILVESVIDAVTLHQVGFRNVSAVYGVQGFTADHAELLQRFRVRRVFLWLDNDAAGTRATATISEKLRGLGIDAVDARVPGAKDPNALLLKIGPKALAEAVKKSLAEATKNPGENPEAATTGRDAQEPPGPPPLTEGSADNERIDREASHSETTSSPGVIPHLQGPVVTVEDGERGGWNIAFPARSYRVRGLSPNGLDQLRVNLRVDCAGRMHVETLDLYSQRSRSGWVKLAAQELGMKDEELTREVNVLIGVLEGLRLDLIKGGEKASGKIEMPDREREAALQALRSPDLMDLVLRDYERAGFVGEGASLSVCHLAAVSRLLDDPLGIFIISRSGAGKSSLQDAVCNFVPDECLEKYTRITGQALFYKDEMSLVRKVLAVDEEQGAAEAGYSLRILQSAQVLSIAATRTDPQSGKLVTQEYKVRGPVSIFLTAALRDALDAETRSRFVQVSIDESPEQTRRILELQRHMDTLDGVFRGREAQAIRRKHHNMHRLLRPLHVVNPYAHLLAYPDQRLQMRREQKKYLTLIKAIALLLQHQREVKRDRRGELEIEYIEVVPADITHANRLAREVLGHNLDDLAPPTRDLLRQLVRMAPENGRRFSREDVKKATGWADWSVREHLRHLVDLEFVVIVSGGNGRRITYELVFDGDPDEDKRYLAGLVDVEELLQRQRKTRPVSK